MFPIKTTVQLVQFTAVTTATVIATAAATGGLILGGIGAVKSLYGWARKERKLIEKAAHQAAA